MALSIRLWKPAGRMVSTAVAVFSILACLWLIGCVKKNEDNSFKELIGVWKTDSPKYQDCTFEISEVLIVFTNGPSHTSVNFIDSVEKSRQSGKIEFRIQYKDREGMSFWLDLFYFVDESGEKIQYKNQKDLIWRRAQ